MLFAYVCTPYCNSWSDAKQINWCSLKCLVWLHKTALSLHCQFLIWSSGCCFCMARCSEHVCNSKSEYVETSEVKFQDMWKWEGLGLQTCLWSVLEKTCLLYFSEAFIFFFSKVCKMNSISTVQVVFCSFQAHSFAPLLKAFVCQNIGNLEALKFWNVIFRLFFHLHFYSIYRVNHNI